MLKTLRNYKNNNCTNRFVAFFNLKNSMSCVSVPLIGDTSGSRGGRTRRAPLPNGRGPMFFFMPKTLIFRNFFVARFARDYFEAYF